MLGPFATASRLFYIAIHQVLLLSHAVKIGHSIAEMLQFFVIFKMKFWNVMAYVRICG